MQFFVYFTVNENTPMKPPTPEGMAKMGRFMKEAMESGMVVATGQMPRAVTEVTLKEDEISVSDGPFIEGKEFIPGFTVIRVNSKQEAIDWTSKLRECMGEGTLKMAQLSGTSFD